MYSRRRYRPPLVELGFGRSLSASKHPPSGSRVHALRMISLLLRTIGDAVKEQGYQRKAAGLGRAANSLEFYVSITPRELLLPFV